MNATRRSLLTFVLVLGVVWSLRVRGSKYCLLSDPRGDGGCYFIVSRTLRVMG